MSSIVNPFTLVVIILDFIRSSVMLTAVWTLLSAATLMAGTGYQLMSWTVTVSQYLGEDWRVWTQLIFAVMALISVVLSATFVSCMFFYFYANKWWWWWQLSQCQNGETSLDLCEARDDGVLGCSSIGWTICKQSTPRSRQITTPTPHRLIVSCGELLWLF